MGVVGDCQLKTNSRATQIWDHHCARPKGYVCSILEICTAPIFYEIWRFQSWAIWRFLNVLFSMKIRIVSKWKFRSHVFFCQPGLQLFTNHFHQSQPYVSWKSYPYQRLSLVIIATILETFLPRKNLNFMLGRWVGFCMFS